jgi:hypothetical protein
MPVKASASAKPVKAGHGWSKPVKAGQHFLHTAWTLSEHCLHTLAP